MLAYECHAPDVTLEFQPSLSDLDGSIPFRSTRSRDYKKKGPEAINFHPNLLIFFLVHCSIALIDFEIMVSTPLLSLEQYSENEIGSLAPKPLAMVPLGVIIISSNEVKSNESPRRRRNRISVSGRRPFTWCL